MKNLLKGVILLRKKILILRDKAWQLVLVVSVV